MKKLISVILTFVLILTAIAMPISAEDRQVLDGSLKVTAETDSKNEAKLAVTGSMSSSARAAFATKENGRIGHDAVNDVDYVWLSSRGKVGESSATSYKNGIYIQFGLTAAYQETDRFSVRVTYLDDGSDATILFSNKYWYGGSDDYSKIKKGTNTTHTYYIDPYKIEQTGSTERPIIKTAVFTFYGDEEVIKGSSSPVSESGKSWYLHGNAKIISLEVGATTVNDQNASINHPTSGKIVVAEAPTSTAQAKFNKVGADIFDVAEAPRTNNAGAACFGEELGEKYIWVVKNNTVSDPTVMTEGVGIKISLKSGIFADSDQCAIRIRYLAEGDATVTLGDWNKTPKWSYTSKVGRPGYKSWNTATFILSGNELPVDSNLFIQGNAKISEVEVGLATPEDEVLSKATFYGAAIRCPGAADDAYNGIRFSAVFDSSLTGEYGIVLISKAKYDALEDKSSVAALVAGGGVAAKSDKVTANHEVIAAVYNIPEANLSDELVACVYIGDVAVYVGTRSIYSVAKAVLADTESAENHRTYCTKIVETVEGQA